MIYFIENNHCVKIGYSPNPRNRISQIQTSIPNRLKCLLIIEGSKDKESELHLKFSKFSINGKWFNYSDEIKMFINHEKEFDLAQYHPKQKGQRKIDLMMQDTSLNYNKIASITGHTYDSVKSMLQPKQELPRWLNLAIYVWEKSKP